MTSTAYIRWVCAIAVLSALLMAQWAFPQNAEPPPETGKSPVAIEYARACLALAEVELDRAQSLNQRVPNIVPRVRLEWLKRNVEFARGQVRVAQTYGSESTVPVQLAFCETAAKNASERYRLAVKTRVHDSNAISALELESLRLKAKTTNLRLRMWKERSYLPSLVDQMQWQIDRMTEQIVELNDRLAALESGR